MLVLLCAGEAGGADGGARGDRDRARPHGDAGPRRRARRGAAAPRRCRPWRRPRAGRGRWRPATCCSRAPSRCSARRATRAPCCCSPTPPWRSPAASSPSARTPSTFRSPRSATSHRCRLKTATLFECAVSLGHDDPELRRFGAEVGLAFQLLDDVLDVTGPPERTGKARGTDLLDGTVTLPLIVAAERDPGLRQIDLPGLDPAGAEEVCERIAATGALETVRARALDLVAAGKRSLARTGFDAEGRRLLELVADGVVQRYS